MRLRAACGAIERDKYQLPKLRQRAAKAAVFAVGIIRGVPVASKFPRVPDTYSQRPHRHADEPPSAARRHQNEVAEVILFHEFGLRFGNLAKRIGSSHKRL